MATRDRGAHAAGGARQADAPERLRALTASVARDRSASDRSPVARGASEEEEGAGRAIRAEKDDAPELEEEQEEGPDATATEEVGGDGVDDDENTSTHLPFAAVEEELPDETHTIDPSYTFSVVTQLRLKGSSVEKEFGLLDAILLSSADVSWAQTPLPVHTLSIVWNTENLTLLVKLLDGTRKVDPSYTISLIRQLIPKGSSVEKEFSDKKNGKSDDGYSPQPDNTDPSNKSEKRDFPEEMSVSPDDTRLTREDYPDHLEESRCITDLPVSKSQAEVKTFPSVRRTCIVRMSVLFITILWMIGSASAGGTPSCQVSSLDTNIRDYCSSDFPTSLCCDALRAAATRAGGQKKCLCLVGEAPDILTIGFSAGNLIRLYNRCTHHQEEFVCDDDDVDTSQMKRDKTTIEEFVDQGDEHGEAPYPRNQHHGFESTDPQHRGQGDEREEAPSPRNRHHKFEPKDPKHQGQGDEREEAAYPSDQHHKFESKDPKHTHQGDSKFDLEDEASKEHQPQVHSYSVVMKAVLIVFLIILLIGSLVEHYRQNRQINWRQLLNLAVAAGLGPNLANGGLPIQVPAIQAPPVVNGVPGPEIQAPRLAMFPRPAEALTLLAYILLDRVRHALRNSMF